MDKKKLKIVILGYGPMLTNLIAGVLDVGAEIVGVFRYDKVRYSRLENFFLDVFNPSEELTYIKAHNIYELNLKSANSAEFKKEILRLNADILLVGSWGEKLKKYIIKLPTIGTINAHPSLLPKFRGPNPYLQAIKNQEKNSGITFHLMDENYDTGAILLQKTVIIKENDTGLELKNKITKLARVGVYELLKELHEDIIIPVMQEENKSSYFPHIEDDEVMLDFSCSASEISAKIRSFHPWYKCYLKYNSQFFIPNPYKIEIIDETLEEFEAGQIIDKAHKEKSLTVVCGDKRAIRMSGISLYGFLEKPFSAFYINHRVKKFSKTN